jgi:hypothetical protein
MAYRWAGWDRPCLTLIPIDGWDDCLDFCARRDAITYAAFFSLVKDGMGRDWDWDGIGMGLGWDKLFSGSLNEKLLMFGSRLRFILSDVSGCGSFMQR